MTKYVNDEGNDIGRWPPHKLKEPCLACNAPAGLFMCFLCTAIENAETKEVADATKPQS